jgi:predicted patatin/cPLA2 family phospholipase
MGRKRIYATEAERQKAFRKRKQKDKPTLDEIQQKRREDFQATYSDTLEKDKELKILTINQRKVIDAWLSGQSYNQLAESYKVSKQAIQQRLVVIEKKLNKYLDTP